MLISIMIIGQQVLVFSNIYLSTVLTDVFRGMSTLVLARRIAGGRPYRFRDDGSHRSVP